VLARDLRSRTIIQSQHEEIVTESGGHLRGCKVKEGSLYRRNRRGKMKRLNP